MVWSLCLILLIGAGMARIVSTYHVFNHTIDEPSHLACGLEWWEQGTYTIEAKHTPLARISIAALPYFAGLRAPEKFTRWQDTYPILSADGHYWRNLTLARVGVLPYFVIAALVVFFWTKRLYGAPAGLAAAFTFTFLPTVLAHSGVATTDIPFTAMFCWSLYAFTLWLSKPGQWTAAQFGVAAGLALCAKISTLAFLPTCGAAILVLYALAGRPRWRALMKTLGVVLVCAFLVTWAVYRFSHKPLDQVTTVPDRMAAKVFGETSRVTGLVRWVDATIQLPAPELLDGVRMMRAQRNEGTIGYLFGHVKRQGGWWYFFFAALALKTPLTVLILALVGSYAAMRRHWRHRTDWEVAAPVAAAVMIMIVTAPSGLNSGVRYVMPMFALLSILAAAGLQLLWTQTGHRGAYRTAAVLLLSWLAVSSLRAHPDYLAYFNAFGGKDPSRLLVISDLDWGQDLTRLATYVRDNDLKHVSIAYDGFYVPESLGLQDTEQLAPCGAHPSGWVAMEARRARLVPECYPWLQKFQPVAIVGKTMWIYHLPEAQ
ncbi:MAG TPA: glycosyltransferase family 39 protein [Candidatus Angelobacter sp.]|nr:glycosyltransferase family 39 protein [Candidatus Angelobacter sp.]